MQIARTLLLFATVSTILPTVAIAQESCNGPVDHPASTTGACACTLINNNPDCGGPTITLNDYVSCGGFTTATCSTINQQVGTSAACVTSFNSTAYNLAYATYVACVAFNGPDQCTEPLKCGFTTCSQATSSTPVNASVYSGSSGQCNWARFNSNSPKRNALFALTPPAAVTTK